MQKYKFTLISLLIILLAAIPLIIFSRFESQKKPTQQTMQRVSPTATPLTTENVQPTLTQIDNSMQQTMNQLDTDLKTSQVDSSQDTTAGL